MNQQSPQQQPANQSAKNPAVQIAIITGIFTIVGVIITYIVAPIIVPRLSSSPTPTPTPKPTATASVIAANSNPYGGGGTLALNDPLSDSSRGYGWQEETNQSSTCTFTGGAYHVSVLGTNGGVDCLAAPDFSNFAFEVQMTIIKGDFGGVAFRFDSVHQTHYSFHVGQDGTYALYLQGTTGTKVLFPTTVSSAIHRGLGQTNIIAVEAQGSTIKLYINRVQIDNVTDSTYSHGRIALIAVTHSMTEVAYSNAKVWTLP